MNEQDTIKNIVRINDEIQTILEKNGVETSIIYFKLEGENRTPIAVRGRVTALLHGFCYIANNISRIVVMPIETLGLLMLHANKLEEEISKKNS